MHEPDWHLLGGDFVGADDGLTPPRRNLGALDGLCAPVAVAPVGSNSAHGIRVSPGGLQIVNLDRRDPPRYLAGSYPRGAGFNGNVYSIRAEGGMPRIRVQCAVRGFEPTTGALHWRLQCIHLLCRHKKTAYPYRYEPLCKRFYHEWRGRSAAADFTLFDRDTRDVTYDHGGPPDDHVMGGHAILSVAARLPGLSSPLLDFVHLRIVGENPPAHLRLAHLSSLLAARDMNIIAMIRAVFAHESGGMQFEPKYYSRRWMPFSKRYHPHPPCDEQQPDCKTLFKVPADPAMFPRASFDSGVGISQFTEVAGQALTAGLAWDWRENVAKGANLFFEKLRATYSIGVTWKTWAWRAWKAYNGSGAAAVAYADRLAASQDGAAVSAGVAPSLQGLATDLAPLPLRAPDPTTICEDWPPA